MDIHFNVIPASEELLCKEEDINKLEDCPLKENVLPPGEVEYNSAQYLNIIDSSKTDVVDYNKLTFQFGCSLITNHILNRYH